MKGNYGSLKPILKRKKGQKQAMISRIEEIPSVLYELIEEGLENYRNTKEALYEGKPYPTEEWYNPHTKRLEQRKKRGGKPKLSFKEQKELNGAYKDCAVTIVSLSDRVVKVEKARSEMWVPGKQSNSNAQLRVLNEEEFESIDVDPENEVDTMKALLG